MSDRNGYYGGWWPHGLGDSGETASESSGLPTDYAGLNNESGESYYEVTGAPTTIAAPELTAPEFAAEQARSRDWLSQLPGAINAAGKVALTASQIKAAVASGAVKPSSTCPSGFLLPSGDCVQAAATPAAAQTQWFPGYPNNAVLVIGIGLLFLVILNSGGGRRR